MARWLGRGSKSSGSGPGAAPTHAPPQPCLTKEQVEVSLRDRHFTSVEGENGPYISFIWGFDPYPEAGLPFFFRVEVSYQEQAPVFVPEVYSMYLMFGAVELWLKNHEQSAMLWSDHDEVVDLVREHLLLRAAIGLDRTERMAHRKQFLEEAGGMFGEDLPPVQYVRFAKQRYGDTHPMVLAAAYDAWRLGDYKDAKAYLTRHLGLEPSAPTITFT